MLARRLVGPDFLRPGLPVTPCSQSGCAGSARRAASRGGGPALSVPGRGGGADRGAGGRMLRKRRMARARLSHDAWLLFFFFFFLYFFFPLRLASQLAAGNLVPPRPALAIGCPQSAVRSPRRAPSAPAAICAHRSAHAPGSAARPGRGGCAPARAPGVGNRPSAPPPATRGMPLVKLEAPVGCRGAAMEPRTPSPDGCGCGGKRRGFGVKRLLCTGWLYGEHDIYVYINHISLQRKAHP